MAVDHVAQINAVYADLYQCKVRADSVSCIGSWLLQVSELQDQLQQKQELVSRLEEDLLAVRQGPAEAGSPAATAAAAADAELANGDLAHGTDTHMMRVIVGQRDRLRQRVQELELQLANTQAELQTAQQSLVVARVENIALIERLRYVGGYRQQAAAARTNAAAAGGGDIEAGADVVGKYSQLYDEGINPFKQFQVGYVCWFAGVWLLGSWCMLC